MMISGCQACVKGLTDVGSRQILKMVSAAAQCSQAKAYSNGATTPSVAPKTGIREESEKVQAPPFAKDLFMGRFDKNVLTYPEVLEKDQLESIENMAQTVKKFFDEKVDSKSIDRDAKIPQETLQGLKDLGLFGLQIPEDHGGLGLTATEYARLNEIIALDGSIAVTLAAHQAIGLKGLLLRGNEEQKKKYLPRLATGEWTAAFALTEPSSGSDAASIKTRARLALDGKSWVINGSKIWISNGGFADFFTVFARTEVTDDLGRTVDKISAFLVERNFGGITNGQPEDKLGIRGSNTCEVHFEDTPVPAENLLGTVGSGFTIALEILNNGRFSMGSSGAGILKPLLSLVTEHCINRTQFGKPLKDFELIQGKLAHVAAMAYAMESMSYMTAAMIDLYEEPECSVESAIVKVFSSDAVWECTSECLQIMGGMGYMKDYPFERILRDARIMQIFEGTNEILRIMIALRGLQHAGLELRDVVKKLRQPLQNPGFFFRTSLENIKKSMNKSNLDLKGSLHPSLCKQADALEEMVLRFEHCVRTSLVRHGRKIHEKQHDLVRLAEIVTQIYAQTAVLSRASRAYCIGLQNAEHEVDLAVYFCGVSGDKARKAFDYFDADFLLNGDVVVEKIASKMFKAKGYAAEHPLKRNF